MKNPKLDFDFGFGGVYNKEVWRYMELSELVIVISFLCKTNSLPSDVDFDKCITKYVNCAIDKKGKVDETKLNNCVEKHEED